MAKQKFLENNSARVAGPAPRFKVRTLAFLTGGVIFAGFLPPDSYAELPDPCRGGCGPSGNLGFVQSGAATYNTVNNTMTVTQTSDKAVLNWNSFNVSENATVNFAQKNASSVALNRIFSATPSKVLGSVNANGQIYLINPSGILFGKNAKINVGGLVASTLNVDTDTFINSGIANALEAKKGSSQIEKDDYAALRNKEGEWGVYDDDQKIVVEKGASIKAKDGGNVTLVGKSVENHGSVQADDGQVLLIAAEDRVYLQPSDDLALRGFLVEVDTGGTVTNTGEVKAERGNVTLAGHAVNQKGVVKATTSIDRNGSVYLQARDGGDVIAGSGGKKNTLTATRGGALDVGKDSLTSIELELDSLTKAIDEQEHIQSQVKLSGKTVHLENNAQIIAHNGVVDIAATSTPDKPFVSPSGQDVATRDDTAYIQMDAGAKIDVQGADATLEMSRNFVTLELYSSELKDSPLQRNGILRGEEITVDIRKGTPLADISAAVAAIPKTLAERASEGGTVNLVSQGAVVIHDDAGIDVSGGEITYEGGYVSTTKLLSNGRVVDISDADPSMIYDGIVGVYTHVDREQGVIYREGRPTASRFYESGYTEGRDAGDVSIAGYNMQLEGDIVSNTVAGRYQSTAATRPQGGSLTIGLPRKLGSLIDNLAPDIELAGQQAQQAANIQLASVEQEFHLAMADALRTRLLMENPELTEEEFADALRAELVKPEVLAQLQAKLLQALGENNKAVINIDRLAASGLQTINVNSNGAITLAESREPLQLADNATLRLRGDRIGIRRSVASAGGALDFASQADIADSVQIAGQDETGASDGIRIADNVVLDTSGEYVNDLHRIGMPGDRSLAIDGGTVSLAVASAETLALGANVSLRADGGAYVSNKGKIKDGKGGTIALDASALDAHYEFSPAQGAGAAGTVSNGLTLSARGLRNNGTLNLGAEGFLVSDAIQAQPGDSKTALVSQEAAEDQGNQLALSSAFLEDGAFANYRLKATRGDVIVDRDTHVDLVQRNYVLNDAAVEIESAHSLTGLSSVDLLDPRLRNAVNLSIAQKTDLDRDLVIGTDASITTEAGGQLAFSNGGGGSGGRILVDGLVQADAGKISFTLTRETQAASVSDTSMIWFGEHASVVSRGHFDEDYNKNAPDTLLGQLVTGTLQGGGAIEVKAAGHLVMQEGAVFDVSATNAEVDVLTGSHTNGDLGYVRQSLSGAAGRIDLTSGEGMLLAGDFRAHSDGVSASPQAGLLSIKSTFEDRGVINSDASDPSLSAPARTVTFLADTGATLPEGFLPVAGDDDSRYFTHTGDDGVEHAVAPGALSAASRGQTVLNAADISATFDNLKITTDGAVNFGQSGVSAGDQHVVLAVDRSIDINAQSIAVLSGDTASTQVDLSANAIELGSASTPLGLGVNRSGIPQAGNGELHVNANTLDLKNSLTVDGVNSLDLVAENDIRLIDTGVVSTVGDMLLSAREVVATTAADLSLRALDFIEGETHHDGHITVNGNGKNVTPVLAAQGKVTLTAANIDQNGALLAPFGSITLDARHLQVVDGAVVAGDKGTLTLADGSITSTSLQGMSVPFGTTLNGLEWVYGSNNSEIFTDGHQSVFSPSVTLQGDAVDIAAGAKVDISGGGDLLAYEYIPGLGGSKDYIGISNAFEDGIERYAIVPALGNASVPYDQKYNTATGAPAVGSTLVIGEGSALPAGEYLLLPAQYALLPGAYLVEKVEGYRDVIANANFQLLDGTAIVAGQQGINGLETADTRWEGYAIRPGSDARQFSEYRETSANKFFAERSALLELAVAPARPADAALLSIEAGERLTLDGSVSGTAGEGGRASSMDISADSLSIVGNRAGAANADGVVLTADQLESLDVGSLLLGGRRTQTGDGIDIDVLANDVTVEEGVAVTGKEIMLVAREQVALERDAQLISTAPAQKATLAVSLNHGGAMMAVSDRRITEVARSDAGSGSAASVAEGARIQSQNSVVLDSTGSTLLAGSLSAPGAVHLGAARVELGRVSGEGLVLTQANLTDLAGVDLLGIQASDRIVLANGTHVNAENLRLTTPLLTASLGDGGRANLVANNVMLAGGQNSVAAVSGQGTLNIDAATLEFGSGALAIGGIDALTVNADKALGFREDGNTHVAATTMTVTTPLVYGADGITAALQVDGALTMQAGAGATPVATGLGAKVDVSAASLSLDNHWAFDSGVLTFNATAGDITLGANADIDVSGQAFKVYETSLYSDAGRIALNASAGDVVIRSGAKLDISAAEGGGDAGALVLNAHQGDVSMAGNLHAQAAHGQSGELAVDAQRYSGGLDALSDLMQASGAHGGLAVRLRGDQTQTLSANKTLKADDLSLALDNAGVEILGRLDASGERGGEIAVMAHGDVLLGGESVLVARGTAERGGSVLVSAQEGDLTFSDGAVIDVRGASGSEGGEVVMRADADDVRGIRVGNEGFAGNIIGARRARLEVHDTPYMDTTSFTQADANQLQARALAIQANAAELRERLQLDSGVDIAAALEVIATGNYIWSQEVNLDEWHVVEVESGDGELAQVDIAPGTLIIRATGNLTMSRSLQDGFNADGVLTDKDSWDFALVAGADTGAVNVMDVTTGAAADFTVGNNMRVRTGNGDIRIAAARDFVLGNNRSAVYSAGRDIGLALDRFDGLAYELAGEKMVAGEGGSVGINAGRDIRGHAPANGAAARVQAWTDWLKDSDAVTEALIIDPETGEPLVDLETGNYLYERVRQDAGRYVDYNAFAQGIAAFGGGDVDLTAGGSVVRVDVSLPTTANVDSVSGNVSEIGRGDLRVSAAGDIVSSNFLIGQGSARVETLGSIRSERTVVTESIAGYTALMGGDFRYVARKDINLSGAFDPGIAQRIFEGVDGDSRFYYTFDDDTAFSAVSTAGQTEFRSAIEAPIEQLLQKDVFFPLASTLVPKDFVLASFAGDVTLSGELRSNIVDGSRFIVWADRNVTLNDGVTLLDNVLADMPTVSSPITGKNSFEPSIEKYVKGATAALEGSDTTVLIAAVNGDVTAPAIFRAPVAVDVYAGNDINGLNLASTHYNESDVTRVTAGRDISLNSGTQKINVAGPGRLEVMAGRNINLGASKGIETVGATTNAQLAGRSGADVYVFAGVKAGDLQYSEFISPLLENASSLDLFATEVQSYVNRTTHENLSQRDAAERFRTLSLEQQQAFVSGIAQSPQQVNTLLSALAYADAITDNISQSAGYDKVLAGLQLSDAGLQALTESFRLHEGSNAATAEVLQQLSSLKPDALQDIVHYSLTLLDEASRRNVVVDAFATLSESDCNPLIAHAFFNELKMSGRNANAGAPAAYDRGYEAADRFFATTTYAGDKVMNTTANGNLSLLLSKVYTIGGGDINLLVPGGYVNAGVVTPPLGDVGKPASQLGIVAQAEGDVNAYLQGDFLVNQSRVFTLQEGDISMWSSAGNIDAGRGAKTAVAAPAPTITLDANGNVVINTAGAVAGSGIRQIDTTGEDDEFEAALSLRAQARSVDLIAPVGEVNAGDAGIGASGNINIAAARVIGADNIDIGGVAVGVPVADTGGFAGGFTGGDSASSAVSKASEDAADGADSDSPQADEALSWLEVTFAGFGDEGAADEEEDKKRRKGNG